MELFQIFIPISIALMAAFIASRGKYIHDFRTFDLNFFSNQILSKNSQDRKTARAYKEIAKVWIIRSLPYKCTALFYTFSIAYMLLALLFFILAFIHTLFLFPAFFFTVFAFFVIIIEEHLHLPPRKSHKMRHKFIGFLIKRVIWLNSSVSCILGKTPFGIQYLSSWAEIEKEMNKLKKFIEKDNHDYFIQPLNEYNLLPWNVCSYRPCKTRIKLRPCGFCEKKFCKKHLTPKIPMRPPFKGKPKEMDDRRKDGHPCPKYPPYLKLKEKEELDKR